MSLFASYESELINLLNSLSSRSPEEDSHFADDVREAESLLAQVDVEARGTGMPDARSRIARLRSQLNGVKDKLDKYKLLSSGVDDDDSRKWKDEQR